VDHGAGRLPVGTAGDEHPVPRAGSVGQRGLRLAFGLSGGVESRLPAGFGFVAEEGLLGGEDEPFPGFIS